MDLLLIAFTLAKAIIILYGAGKGVIYLFNGFSRKNDALKIRGFKYAAISIGLVISLSILEFILIYFYKS